MKHIAVDVSPLVKNVQGMSYISWADALAICSPLQHVVLHPVCGVLHPIFGGGVVAIDQELPGGRAQRTWLTVLNERGGPVPYAQITSRDAGDTINRCRARSAAVVDGLGIGLYLDEANGAKFLKRLGVNQGTVDLGQVPPWMLGKKGDSRAAQYLPWAAALAAARLTDPEFHWEVVEFDTVNEHGEACRAPYVRVPSGYLVAVDLVWKGRMHREFLPIMGILPVQTKNGVKKLDHQPLTDPDAADWHKATMRALAKGIALLTGYGRSAYADELATPADAGATSDAISQIQDLIAETNANTEAMLKHYGVPSLEATPPEVAERMLAALRKKRDGSTPLPVAKEPEPEAHGEAAPAENSSLLSRIEQLVADKRVPEPLLLSFFGGKPPQEASSADLQRVLSALEKMKPNPRYSDAQG